MIFKRINDSLNGFSALITNIQEFKYFAKDAIFENYHVLSESFNKAQETSFSVIPGVHGQFFVVWLQTFDDPANSELIVSFSAIESSDYQINDAQVIDMFIRGLELNLFLLPFKFPHDFLGLFVLINHDIRDA